MDNLASIDSVDSESVSDTDSQIIQTVRPTTAVHDV